jgi:NarL family two-component system response regulator LiaR
MKTIKILIADDHPMMREAFLAALAIEPELLVVGEASNGLEALEMSQKLSPDVLLIDLLMPQMNGLEAIARIQQEAPQVRIMVVSSLEDEEKILAAVQAGALGYFPKTAPRAYLIEGIRKVADGVPYLPAGIAAKLFKGLREMKTQPAPRSALDEPLTSRQDEVLTLIGEGLSDQEISEALHLSESTVRSHTYNIIRRLGLKSRAQIVTFANREHRSK